MKKDKAFIVYNRSIESACILFDEMQDWMAKRNIETCGFDAGSYQKGEALPEARFAVSLGGDGTFLTCARMVSVNPIPILPIHLGTFGFITEVQQEEWEETLEMWLAGRLRVDDRMVIDISVWHKGEIAERFIGINDAVVSTSGISKIIRLSIQVGGFPAGRFLGDGMILSTPTGSTAYSMAAGGPIMVPPMSALVLTPICPFSLAWRPMVMPDSDEVVISVDPGQRAQLLLTVDGQESYPLEEEDIVKIKGRQGGMKIIKSPHRNFYEVIRTKLGWSGGPHA